MTCAGSAVSSRPCLTQNTNVTVAIPISYNITKTLGQESGPYLKNNYRFYNTTEDRSNEEQRKKISRSRAVLHNRGWREDGGLASLMEERRRRWSYKHVRMDADGCGVQGKYLNISLGGFMCEIRLYDFLENFDQRFICLSEMVVYWNTRTLNKHGSSALIL